MEEKKNTGSVSRAELARQRRKASIEEEAKRQAEKEAEKVNQKSWTKWVKIGVPVFAVLLALLLFLLSFFGVFTRQATAIKFKDGSHTKVSGAVYEYYYRMYYNYYANMSEQYEQQYSTYFGSGAGKTMTGFDYMKKPSEQAFVSKSGESVPKKYGSHPTWADYFEYKAIEDSETNTRIYKIAEDKGYKLTKSEQKDLDNFIDELSDAAKQNNYSLDAYLRTNYGKGMTEKLLRRIYTEQTVAQKYISDLKAKDKASVTSKEIQQEYKKNQKDYTKINIRYYQISENMADSKAKKLSAAQKKKINSSNEKKAKAFVSKATDGNFADVASEYASSSEKASVKSDASYTTLSDTTYSSLSSYVNKTAADWAFASGRKVGDKKYFVKTDSNGLKSYAVLLVASDKTRDETVPVSVRHILIKAGTDSSTGQQTRSDAEAKKLAEAILKKYNSGKKTEASFAALAKEYTEDDGSKENGGLYEDVTSNSQYVDSFKNWALAGHSKGDVEIIKSNYGYHIMYYVGKSKYPQWALDVRDAVANKKYEAWYHKIINQNKIKVSKSWEKKVRKRVDKTAETVITNASQSSSQQQSYGAY